MEAIRSGFSGHKLSHIKFITQHQAFNGHHFCHLSQDNHKRKEVSPGRRWQRWWPSKVRCCIINLIWFNLWPEKPFLSHFFSFKDCRIRYHLGDCTAVCNAMKFAWGFCLLIIHPMLICGIYFLNGESNQKNVSQTKFDFIKCSYEVYFIMSSGMRIFFVFHHSFQTPVYMCIFYPLPSPG